MKLTATRSSFTSSGAVSDPITQEEPSLDLNFAGSKALLDDVNNNNPVTFTRASSGTFVGADGLIKTASTNEARFDHDLATGESLGLLIEKARTNLVKYSEQLNQWNAGPNTTVTTNAATAPDGTNTADRLQMPTGGGTYITSDNNFIVNGKTYTGSVYVKAVTPGTNDQFAFSFGGESSANQTSRFTATGDWQRIEATKTTTLNQTRPFVINNEGDNFATDIYVWGAQVEEAPFATSYIPTTSSQVTRAADIAEITGTNFSSFYNQSEGTMFVDAGTSANTVSFNLFEYSNGTIGVRHSVRYDASNSRVEFTGNTASQQYVSLSSPASIKAAATQSLGFAVNGVLTGDAGTSNSGTKTQLAIGYRSPEVVQFINGHIKRLSYFPTNLADATLQSITS